MKKIDIITLAVVLCESSVGFTGLDNVRLVGAKIENKDINVLQACNKLTSGTHVISPFGNQKFCFNEYRISKTAVNPAVLKMPGNAVQKYKFNRD